MEFNTVQRRRLREKLLFIMQQVAKKWKEGLSIQSSFANVAKGFFLILTDFYESKKIELIQSQYWSMPLLQKKL